METTQDDELYTVINFEEAQVSKNLTKDEMLDYLTDAYDYVGSDKTEFEYLLKMNTYKIHTRNYSHDDGAFFGKVLKHSDNKLEEVKISDLTNDCIQFKKKLLGII